MTKKNDKTSHEDSPETDEDVHRDQASGTVQGPGVSGFSEEQLAQLQELIAAQDQPPAKGWLRSWLRRNLTRGRSFVHAATPADEDTDFDQETFTGRLAARASKHRGLAALAAVMAILLLGGFWGMILGGGLPLPVVAAIVVAVLCAGLVFGLVLRRRNQ